MKKALLTLILMTTVSSHAFAQMDSLTISSDMASLTDVTTTGVADDDILYYSAGTGKWEVQSVDEYLDKAAGGTSVIIRGAAGALTTTGTGNIVIGESSDPANSGSYNVLIGNTVVQAGGNNSHLVAIGSNITTGSINEDSVVMGYQATVSVQDAVAIGPQATVSGRHGTAVGDDTDAGHGSVALGIGAQALPADTGATAVGRNATASGNFSTAVGHTTTASYDSSTAVGYEATTTAIDQIMMGSAGTIVALGQGITFTSGNMVQKAGAGTETFSPCGTIEYNLATETTIGAGEDVLATYALPADTFNTNGQRIRISAWGSTPNNVNAKTLKTYFGSLINTNSLATSLANEWEVSTIVFRSATDVQEYFSNTLHDSAAGAEIPDREMSTLTEDDGSAITIKITGEGTTDGDIVIEGFTVEFCG